MNITADPFRLFFPLGALCAIAGVLPWTFHIFGLTTYPVEFHRVTMMNGFMLSFVSGFLMTAIPRFTSAGYGTRIEIVIVAAAIAASMVFAFTNQLAFHHLAAALAVVTLMVFGFLRFRRRKTNPPFTFVFVGLGLSLWTIANLFAAGNWIVSGMAVEPTSVWGAVLSSGALMAIVLGIGGRLVPGILGWQEIVSEQRRKYEGLDPFLTVVPVSIIILVGIYLLSYFLQPFLPPLVFFSMRAFVIWFFAFRYWKLHRPPKEKSYLTWCVWLASWCFVIGAALNVFWLEAQVHALHTILIGGFSLLTILIATRVTLAHGNSGREPEKTSKIILVFTGLILLAMVTRVTAIIWPAAYLNHLGYASFTWMLGFLMWMGFAIPRMWRK